MLLATMFEREGEWGMDCAYEDADGDDQGY